MDAFNDGFDAPTENGFGTTGGDGFGASSGDGFGGDDGFGVGGGRAQENGCRNCVSIILPYLLISCTC